MVALLNQRIASVLILIFVGGSLVLYLQWRALPLGTFLLRSHEEDFDLRVPITKIPRIVVTLPSPILSEAGIEVEKASVRVDNPALVIAYCTYDQAKRRFVSSPWAIYIYIMTNSF
jgi:hypothetical protein